MFNGIIFNQGIVKKINKRSKGIDLFIQSKIKLSSKDDFSTHKGKQITNSHSQKVSHLLRYKNQGILITSKTCNSDNSRLDCRLDGIEKFSPIKFILDKDLKINLKSNIVKSSKKHTTFIFHNSKNSKKIKKLKLYGHKLIKHEIEPNGYFDLKKLFKKIYNLGIHNILVECGRNLTYKMLKSNLFLSINIEAKDL